MYSMHDQMNMATLRTGVYDDNSDSSLTQWILALGTSKPCGIGAYRFNNFENGHRRARSSAPLKAGSNVWRYLRGTLVVLKVRPNDRLLGLLDVTLATCLGLNIAWNNLLDARMPFPFNRSGCDAGSPGFFAKLERNMKLFRSNILSPILMLLSREACFDLFTVLDGGGRGSAAVSSRFAAFVAQRLRNQLGLR